MCTTTTIPVFFATDDNYAPFLGVAIKSMTENLSKDSVCKIHVLTSGLSVFNRAALKRSVSGRSTVEFVDVSEQIKSIASRLHIRDYYTKATYYRFFIADLFPEYDKALYLDCDIVVNGDITELYNTDLGNKLVGAIQEEVMQKTNVFGAYVEKVLNIPRSVYFNAGILVMNLAEFRKRDVEGLFIDLLGKRRFDVTQDQDYLNVICYGSTVPIGIEWNKTPFINPAFDHSRAPKLVHYKINWKPWHYSGVMYEKLFWLYADKTVYRRKIRKIFENYSSSQKASDALAYKNLYLMAARQTLDATVTYCESKA